jgi:hypothetical protein
MPVVKSFEDSLLVTWVMIVEDRRIKIKVKRSERKKGREKRGGREIYRAWKKSRLKRTVCVAPT